VRLCEPFLALAGLERREALDHAWRLLLKCQPHDSICGCSIDAVHEEMRTRFDQVEQIGEELTRQALQALADEVDSGGASPPGAAAALVVFNAASLPAAGRMRAALDLPAGIEPFEVVERSGHPIPHRLLKREAKVLAEFDLDPDGLRGMLAMAQDGRVFGLALQAAAIVPQAGGVLVDVVLHEHALPDLELLAHASAQLDRLLNAPQPPRIRLIVRLASRAEIEVLAPQVPSSGLRTLWLRRAAADPPAASHDSTPRIANDSLGVEAAPDGTLSITDRRTRRCYAGLLRFSDVAECGDSYTHCPLQGETALGTPQGSVHIERRRDALGESLHLAFSITLPRGLTPDRSGRRSEGVPLPVRINAQLAPGIPRLDLAIEVENVADDHRLQVLFPTGAPLSEAWYGGSYEIVRRPTNPAAGGADWAEQPAREVPLRGFVADRPSDGLLIAAHGLREASASPDGVLAVTLLRCFGWLSRDDLASRQGAAGPLIETPGGQQHGLHRVELSIIPFAGDLLSALPLVEAFDLGLRAVMTPLHAGRLPAEAAFLSTQPETVQLTAAKAAEDGSGMVVRLVNLSPWDVPAEVTSLLPLRRAERARLDETVEGPPPVIDGGRVLVPLGPHQAATVRLDFAVSAPGRSDTT
jgi:alpha-mannosidase